MAQNTSLNNPKDVENSKEEDTWTNSEEDLKYHNKTDPHGKANRTSQLILGSQDGIVNTLGVILGVAAVSGSTQIIIASGLAALFAESISIGAVGYTSKIAEKGYYESELERELRHIKKVPKYETNVIRQIYKKKGFHGELLDQIVKTICSNDDTWADVLMNEEHNISSVSRKEAFIYSLYVFWSALIGSFVPILPFFFVDPFDGTWISLGISAALLFMIGYYKSFAMKVGNPYYSGIEITIIGTISALSGWGIGLAFNKLWPRS